MTAAFAIPLVLGIVLLLVWIGLGAASSMVPAWEGWDPDTRFGSVGRMVVGGAVGFGMGGISALYAGSAGWLALVAAVAGAGVLAFASSAFGPSKEAIRPEEG